jgi:tRNA A-37 threonylcarbamoyl transferase component Bud32/tetratricopeptide (TPR) repeat protein
MHEAPRPAESEPPTGESTLSMGPLTPPAGPRGAHLAAGTVVDGRYEIRAFLGRGGYGAVYRVYDRLLKTEVALKLVHPERDPERALVRLRREVAIARESPDPHLVRVFDLGQTYADLYLTMEFLRGGSLRKRLDEGPLAIPEAVRVAEALLRGLAALHAKGAVHRDVTPGNILFSETGEAKLADFGLVRHPGREETGVTARDAVLGTAGYRSPEQFLGRKIGPRSDLFSAGVVLFEMVAGRLPHEAVSESGRSLGPLHKAPGLRTVRPVAPRWLAAVVARLLEVHPADRYPHAEAVLRDLGRHSSPPHFRLRRYVFRTAVIGLFCLPRVGILITTPPAARYSHLVPAGDTGIAAVSSTGERLWTIDGVDPSIVDRGALARITPGGPRLLAIVLMRPGEWSPEAVSTLSFLDPDSGRIVKQVKLPSGEDHFPNDPPRFFFASAKAVDLSHDGADEILVNYSHVPEAPFYTVLYAPRFEQARIVFYSRGGQDFQGATDLDGDGDPELLFAGINNGWNWVNAVAAVRLDPRSLLQSDRLGAAAPPDAMERPSQARLLLWYATVPRGHLENPPLTIDEGRRELTVHYRSGRTWTLGFDGFPPGGSESDRAARQAARREAYAHLWEAERLRRAGMFDLAMPEAAAALDSASRARETWLGQYAERLEAKILVAEGQIPEGEARFASLAERADDEPEVAYDAAVAFHLAGDLRRAVRWYGRGTGRKSTTDAGKSKHEFLKGEVLALVEARQYSDALAAIDRFVATYPMWESHAWTFREYVRWRAGERPQANPSAVPRNWPDLERYWELEFEFAEGGEPGEILRRVDTFLAERPETNAEALSLRAEILARLGRRREAAEEAQVALELVRVERGRSIIARGHADLLAARTRRPGDDLGRRPAAGGAPAS